MPKDEKPIRQNIAEEVTVRKEELLQAVRANRENHRKEFELAVDGWHDAVLAALADWQERAKKGERVHVYVSLPPPEDHTKDYDRTIRMLEMHVDDLVTVPTEDFSQMVMNDWNWVKQWTSSNSAYVQTAATKFAAKSKK